MAKILETKACRACAIAKRRCGKQTPHCLRCRTRGLECTYPSTKPSSFVLCREEPLYIEFATPPEVRSQSPLLHSHCLQTGGVGGGRLSSGLRFDFSGLSGGLIDDHFFSEWFASLDKWQIRLPSTDQGSIYVPDLQRFITRIFRWLAEWVKKGSNSFIHPQLYRTRSPRCVQDAYSALSCYFHRTESNEHIAFRIIEDRVKMLVAEYGIPSAGSPDDTTTSTPLDPLEHVARVHALLVYQIIGLYNGDIRLRHLSETYLPVLSSWMQDMVLHNSQTASLGRYLISPTQEQAGVCLGSSYASEREDLLWYSWILAESTRRTWVVASGIQLVFTALQQKSVDSCQGGMMITTRQGIWEAQSSVAWEKLCLEVHVGLMQMAEVENLLTDFAPSEVNEFTKAVLEVAFGRDRMKRWGVQVEE